MTETRKPSPADAKEGSVVESPPLVPAGAPVGYVVDDDGNIRHFLSLVLHGAGIDALDFPDGMALREAMQRRVADLVFLNVSLESVQAIETLIALGKTSFSGHVQLMSSRGAAVLEHVKSVGAQHGLKMLPVLKKPFETDAISKILQALNLGTPSGAAASIDLSEALEKGWMEFWYQPKIDLRRKQLAGAEGYARARHPVHGIALPGSFMPNAKASSVIGLSELALVSALKTGLAFSQLGVHLKLTVNIPVDALEKIAVEEIVYKYRPRAGKWAGLIIDVPEEQIVNDLTLASKLSARLERCNVRLAIDDFGRGTSSLARLGEMPFAELKLDRTFVADCGTNRVNAPLCKTVIDLAHNFGKVAVAMGIEKAADAMALVSMGCDYGQGFLLGQPMPEERFVSLLRQRAGAKGQDLPATAS
jgi:EAL domain-containing protein (putative c-di-GMP-specific phosphodiesterase class I)